MHAEEEIIAKASEHIGLDVDGPQREYKQSVVMVTKSGNDQFHTCIMKYYSKSNL
jgi:hypothetical protein